MTDAELRSLREALGVTTKWMAAYLGVDEREYRRMESNPAQRPGRASVKADQAAMVQGLWLHTQSRIQDEIAEAAEADEVPAWVTYRTDEDADADGIESAPSGPPLTAAWHRSVVLGAWGVVGGSIAYFDPDALDADTAAQAAQVEASAADLEGQAQDGVSSQ